MTHCTISEHSSLADGLWCNDFILIKKKIASRCILAGISIVPLLLEDIPEIEIEVHEL